VHSPRVVTLVRLTISLGDPDTGTQSDT